MGFGQQSMKATKEFKQQITFEKEVGKSMRATKEFGNRITFEEEEGKSMRATEEFGQTIGYTTTGFNLQITFKE